MEGIIFEEAQPTLENNCPGFDVNIKLIREPAWSVEKHTAKERSGE
jgi:hypothetical protein